MKTYAIPDDKNGQGSNVKGWGFAYDPIPKGAAKRLAIANVSKAAILLYLEINEHLNVTTKSGWTIGLNDTTLSENLGFPVRKVSDARKELTRVGLVESKSYENKYGSRVVGSRIFNLTGKETIKKLQKKRSKKNEKPVEKRTKNLSQNVQESRTKKNEKPVHLPTEKCGIKNHTPTTGEPVVVGVPAVGTVFSENCINTNIKTTLSPPTPSLSEGEKKNEVVSGGEKEREMREGFGKVFSETVWEKTIYNKRKLAEMDTYFEELAIGISEDNRVGSIEGAHEVLLEAFSRVKSIITPIYSHTIFDVGYGEDAIEWAIQRYEDKQQSDTASPDYRFSDENDEITQPIETESDDQAPIPAKVAAATNVLVEGDVAEWSEEAWLAWRDKQVQEKVEIRRGLSEVVGTAAYTDDEIEEIRARFNMPQSEKARAKWCRNVSRAASVDRAGGLRKQTKTDWSRVRLSSNARIDKPKKDTRVELTELLEGIVGRNGAVVAEAAGGGG